MYFFTAFCGFLIGVGLCIAIQNKDDGGYGW